MKEITFTKIDGRELSSFVKKLLPIDKFIFMKIGGDNTMSSVYLPERDAVKLVKQNTSDIFDGHVPDQVKVSFYNGTKVVDALSHFHGDINGRIKYSDIDGELIASDFMIENEDLTINLACSDPSLSFMEMNKEEMSRAFSTDSSLFQFDLLTTQTDRIKSLFSLDKDEEVFTIYVKDGNIRVKGTSYDSIVCSHHSSDAVKEEDSLVVIYKKYLNLLDKENYQVIVCSNKVVFKSLDTDTVLTVAVAMMAED
tara:strand:- start:1816 stop:2574 length:759 start_codon:yes stop_codon:yes gene_type:complete